MSEDKRIILILSVDTSLCDQLEPKLNKKGATVIKKHSLDEAVDFLKENKITHLMIDLCFTPFEKAKFLRSVKKVAVIAPKIKTISFKEVLSKFDNAGDGKIVVSSGKAKEDNFAQEVNSFILGDKKDVSQDYTQLYSNPLKTFVQHGQVNMVVQFLEMTEKGIIVLADSDVDKGEEITVKIENFLNKAGSVIEFTTSVIQTEPDDENKYYMELYVSDKYVPHWSKLFEEYNDKQSEIDEFIRLQKY